MRSDDLHARWHCGVCIGHHNCKLKTTVLIGGAGRADDERSHLVDVGLRHAKEYARVVRERKRRCEGRQLLRQSHESVRRSDGLLEGSLHVWHVGVQLRRVAERRHEVKLERRQCADVYLGGRLCSRSRGALLCGRLRLCSRPPPAPAHQPQSPLLPLLLGRRGASVLLLRSRRVHQVRLVPRLHPPHHLRLHHLRLQRLDVESEAEDVDDGLVLVGAECLLLLEEEGSLLGKLAVEGPQGGRGTVADGHLEEGVEELVAREYAEEGEEREVNNRVLEGYLEEPGAPEESSDEREEAGGTQEREKSGVRPFSGPLVREEARQQEEVAR
mmetsp:Transcript_2322/g.8257  ORF Transcript_2322/g.8257 Transcript_2322/m.8257 type:complete len:328 (-) Transcript_2322:191-1174(-)